MRPLCFVDRGWAEKASSCHHARGPHGQAKIVVKTVSIQLLCRQQWLCPGREKSFRAEKLCAQSARRESPEQRSPAGSDPGSTVLGDSHSERMRLQQSEGGRLRFPPIDCRRTLCCLLVRILLWMQTGPDPPAGVWAQGAPPLSDRCHAPAALAAVEARLTCPRVGVGASLSRS